MEKETQKLDSNYIIKVLFSFVILITITLLTIWIYKHYKKPQPAILGGLTIPREHIPMDTTSRYFDTEYAGDTACFKLTSETTIELKCICSCNEYQNK